MPNTLKQIRKKIIPLKNNEYHEIHLIHHHNHENQTKKYSMPEYRKSSKLNYSTPELRKSRNL